MLHIFDTDHISLLQRRNANVIARLERISLDERAVTIITVIEQIQGRLAVIHHATSEAAEHLQLLFAALHQQGYQTVGSTIRDGAAVQDKLFMAGAHVDPNLL